MITFFKVLLHCLYFTAVVGIEILLWTWMEPNIGALFTAIVCIFVLWILMMIYAAIFWNWRPSWSGGGGDFFDIGDLF